MSFLAFEVDEEPLPLRFFAVAIKARLENVGKKVVTENGAIRAFLILKKKLNDRIFRYSFGIEFNGEKKSIPIFEFWTRLHQLKSQLTYVRALK